MEDTTQAKNYIIKKPETWAATIDDSQLIAKIKESDFSRKQVSEGKDYCYFLDKIYYTNEKQSGEYVSMAYTLNEPENLERASVRDVVLEENEQYCIHRISVLRDGVLIDKIPDASIKVLDEESQSQGGVLNSTKKINITIKDLRLFDVLILEDTTIKTYKETDFLRKDFARYVLSTPDVYWAYGSYKFSFIHDREKTLAYKKLFFRDENAQLLEPEMGYLKKGEQFVFEKNNYINFFDNNRELAPFIDFASDCSWEELSDYISPVYEETFKKASLQEFAPNLVEKLDAITNLDEKLQFAIEYVQRHIYYIFNMDEMSSHKPQDPVLTYQNKQGDCKAKSVLLKVILDYIGIESSIVLVNFRTDYYIKHYLPSLLVFNHVIVKINYNDEIYFVDPTSRDEYGLIENRGFVYFMYYLEIAPGQELKIRNPYRFPYYCIDEKVDINVKNTIGELKLTSTYRSNRANNMRKYFKEKNKIEIIDSWNNFLFYALNYNNDRNGTDLRTVFKDASIQILNDDKKTNTFTIEYKATIENPYFVDTKNNRFLMYFDRNILKTNVREYIHKDVPFWHGFDSEKYEMHLYTDKKIDMEEKFTIQETSINNAYFEYNSRKKIAKNGGSVFITYKPLTNLEVLEKDFEKLKSDYQIIDDSNFGLGIDIIEPGIMNKLKFNLKKMLK